MNVSSGEKFEFYYSAKISDEELHTPCTLANRTNVIIKVYAGVPETFLLSILAFTLMLIIFALIRRRVWDYGRLAYIGNNKNDQTIKEKNWFQIFYANQLLICTENHPSMLTSPFEISSKHSISSANCQVSPLPSSTSLLSPSHQQQQQQQRRRSVSLPRSPTSLHSSLSQTKMPTTTTAAAATSTTTTLKRRSKSFPQVSIPRQSSISPPFINDLQRLSNLHQYNDKNLFKWILIPFKLKKRDFFNKCGPDAVYYLNFQEHLILLTILMTVVSVLLILPLNFQGNLEGTDTSFGHTTLSNLKSESNLLWVHIIAAMLYVPLTAQIMNRSSGRLAFSNIPTRVVMIKNLTVRERDENSIRNYLETLFPSVHIDDIQLAYDLSELMNKYEEFKRIRSARKYCQKRSDLCGKLIAKRRFLPCNKIPILEYYENEEEKLKEEVKQLRSNFKKHPVGAAFITLGSIHDAKQIIEYYRTTIHLPWTLSYAPAPLDIIWSNLSADSRIWYLKWFTANVLLFILLFFLTTPAIVLSQLNEFKLAVATQDTVRKISPNISELVPVLLLLIMTALMPALVAASEYWLKHWSHSMQNFTIMNKTYGFLLLMIIILPSLGLTSVQALLRWMSANYKSRWECVFLPDRGAFYVNYVITSAFIGTGLELLRIPQLITYAWNIYTAKSIAERPYIRENMIYKFAYGTHYAWILIIFTLSSVYSMPCPLIMPFATIYFCLKHLIDRYNLYFIYSGTYMISQLGGKIHSNAIAITKFSIILLMIVLFAFIGIRSNHIDIKAIILLVFICLTVSYYLILKPFINCSIEFNDIHTNENNDTKTKTKTTTTEKNLNAIPVPSYSPESLITDIIV